MGRILIGLSHTDTCYRSQASLALGASAASLVPSPARSERMGDLREIAWASRVQSGVEYVQSGQTLSFFWLAGADPFPRRIPQISIQVRVAA